MRLRWLMLFALCLLAYAHRAEAQCTNLPYTFTNGTIADANQVNANFSATFNCAENAFNRTTVPLSLVDTQTGAISTTGATASAVTSPAVSADTILSYAFCTSAACLPFAPSFSAGAGNYDAVRGVAIANSGSTTPIIAGVSGYALSNQAFSGAGPAPVALFGTGAVGANNGQLWGVNTNITDCLYRTDCSSSATGRVIKNEFDLSFSSTHSTGAGLLLTGNSVAQPTNVTGVTLAYLDLNNNGTIAKWAQFLDTLDGATTLFLIAGAQAANAGSTTSNGQIFQYGAFTGGVGVVGQMYWGSDSVWHWNAPLSATAFQIPSAGGIVTNNAISIGAQSASGSNIASYFEIWNYFDNSSAAQNYNVQIDTSRRMSFSNSANAGTYRFVGQIMVTGMPTSCSGQPTGTFWNNSNVVNVCP